MMPEQGCRIPCIDCRILGGPTAGCPTCGGAGEVFQAARMADESLARELGAEMADRLAGEGRTLAGLRAALVELLVHGEPYARGLGQVGADALRESLRREILDRPI